MAELLSEDIFAFLQGDPILAGLVGQRIYPVVRPQLGPEQRQPSLTYRLASRKGNLLVGKQKDGRTENLYQFIAWGKTYTGVKQIVKSLYDALESHHRPFASIQLIVLEDEFDDYNPETAEFFSTLELRFIEIRQRT